MYFNVNAPGTVLDFYSILKVISLHIPDIILLQEMHRQDNLVRVLTYTSLGKQTILWALPNHGESFQILST